MESKIKRLIKLTNHPVAVLQSDECPSDAIQLKEGKWGCTVALLAAAAKGKTAALSDKTTVCVGGRAGLGFQPYPLGWIEYFLSTGSEDSNQNELPSADSKDASKNELLSTGSKNVSHCEHYKKTPEIARRFVSESVNPLVKSFPRDKQYLLFKPLELTEASENPLCIVFLANADQISALATLANYDTPRIDNVRTLWGAGCAQTVLYPATDAEHCYVGLTDPSVRKCIDKDLLSFSIPYRRFLELEEQAEESFLTTDTWEKIAARISNA